MNPDVQAVPVLETQDGLDAVRALFEKNWRASFERQEAVFKVIREAVSKTMATETDMAICIETIRAALAE